MNHSLFPWLQELWQNAWQQQNRLPHAILLAGAEGGGKRVFAEYFAQRLLCDKAEKDEFACGECNACRWFVSGNHPDILRVMSEAEQEADADASETDANKNEGKSKSSVIKIEQIRAVQDALSTKAHHGAYRVVMLYPAEAMQGPAANALLKLLEEPPEGVIFILISQQPRKLLPTIRSRCQVWNVPRPIHEQAISWLKTRNIEPAEALLGFASGMPLMAERLADPASYNKRERFIKDLNSLSQKTPLQLAAEWDAWLKAKENAIQLSDIVLWLQRWVSDCALLAQGMALRFFPDHNAQLQSIASKVNVSHWIACYNQLLDYKRAVTHPLNTRLFLEDMLLRYSRTVSIQSRS